MKMLLAILLLSSTLGTTMSAAEKPSWGTSLDADTKTVTLEVYNNDPEEVHCKYSVSWMVNVTTYKKQFGKLVLAPGGAASVAFQNDRFDNISRIRAKVSCE